MKIVDQVEKEVTISRDEAEKAIEKKINNKTKNHLYVVKYKGELVSFSGEYYKFAWKDIRYLRAALTNKFGKEFTEAAVEDGLLEIIRLTI